MDLLKQVRSGYKSATRLRSQDGSSDKSHKSRSKDSKREDGQSSAQARLGAQVASSRHRRLSDNVNVLQAKLERLQAGADATRRRLDGAELEDTSLKRAELDANESSRGRANSNRQVGGSRTGMTPISELPGNMPRTKTLNDIATEEMHMNTSAPRSPGRTSNKPPPPPVSGSPDV